MRIFISLSLLIVGSLVLAQENLQNYTPSILFDKGDWEFKTFQNLYTQSKSFDSGKKVKDANSQYFFTNINQFLYGLNDQVNIGFDVWVKSSDRAKDGLDPSYGVTGFGPKIKIAPFKNIPRLSLQSTLLFNLADDPEGNSGERYFLENDATLWLNQLFFDVPINDKSQLFFQQAFWYRFVKDGSFQENNSLQTQTSVFYSYFPTSRLTLYAMSEYFPTHYNGNDQKGEAFFSYFIQSGIGTKYQAIPNKLELEFLYTNFWNGSQAAGAGQTFNLGIRLINQ
ncbi:MAG: hypothetical protein AB8B73_14555 [Ekhidna sp.]